MMFRIRANGFTLAELLIALAILGVVATFTIPKILSSQNDSQKKAILREVIAALSDATYQGQFTGELDGANFSTYLLSKMNAIKLCPTDADAENCWTQATPGGSAAQAGFTFANGATVAGVDVGSTSGSGYREVFFVDWNGEGLPNVEGQDQIRLRACWGNGNCSSSQKPGTVVAEPGQATSETFFLEIFQN